ncbi:MAG: DUF3347 domain-containing protein [Taibaiella sp.]|jgi:hypothetical protein
MKNIILGLAASALLLSACNSETKPDGKAVTDSTAATLEGSIDTKATESGTGKIVVAYLQMKNALAKDDDKQTAEAGKVLVQTISMVNTQSLSPDQSKVFADVSDDVKEHGEHISDNAGNIKHQREHFEMLSKDIYDLVKAGGSTGQKLYLTHCPMYNNNKGANWLSETKEISNPYLGKAMPDCGTIKEELSK